MDASTKSDNQATMRQERVQRPEVRVMTLPHGALPMSMSVPSSATTHAARVEMHAVPAQRDERGQVSEPMC